MVEREGRVGSDLSGGVVELNDFDPVRVLLEEAGDCEPVLFVLAHAPVHGVDVPWGFVCVDLGSSLLLVRPVLIWVAARTHFPLSRFLVRIASLYSGSREITEEETAHAAGCGTPAYYSSFFDSIINSKKYRENCKTHL